MVRSYDDVFGELEELFPLEGERRRELLEALDLVSRTIAPVRADDHPLGFDLVGRVTDRPIELPPAQEGDEDFVIPAGTFLEPAHVDRLQESGVERLYVRRVPTVAVLNLVADSPADSLHHQLAGWPVEVEPLNAEGPEQVLAALAEAVTHRLAIVLADEESRSALAPAARALGSRTLVDGLTVASGSRTLILSRRECTMLVLRSGGSLTESVIVAGLLGRLLGVHDALPPRLPTTRDLPMTEETGLLVPARLGAGRRGPLVTPLGEPGDPSSDDLLAADCAVYLPPHSLPVEPPAEVHVLALKPRSVVPSEEPDGAAEVSE